MKGYVVEYKIGKVSMIPSNMLLKDVRDMSMIEFWEDRLTKLKQPFVVAYRPYGDLMLYSIFTPLRSKESIFR